MFLARVIGQVVATRKEASLQGKRLLVLRPLLADPDKPGGLKYGSNTVIALDGVGAGEGATVLFVQGSSARMCEGMKPIPTDAAVVGIVDSVQILGEAAELTDPAGS